MLKLNIIGNNTWLETLLKQHFSNIECIEENADIIINNDVNINVKAFLPNSSAASFLTERSGDRESHQETHYIPGQATPARDDVRSLVKTWLLQKPVSINNLINVIEQAIELLSEDIIQIGPISFYPKEKLCKFGTQDIHLTPKETEILLYLFEQKKEVDKLTLLHEIWGYAENISTHTLETHIYKLRSKFNGYEIITSNGLGYQIALD